MKELWKSGVLILLIIGVLYIIFLRECKRPLPCPTQDEVIIKKSTWDSILALANKPAEVRIDTQYIKGEVIYISVPVPTPTPDPIDSTINHYSDSLVKDDIDVHISLKIKGKLLDRTWQYSPIQTVVNRDSIIYIPKVILEYKEVETPVNGFYGNVVFGGNENAFLFGGGIDFITKKDTEIGYQYQRYGNNNFHSIKLGARLFNKR